MDSAGLSHKSLTDLHPCTCDCWLSKVKVKVLPTWLSYLVGFEHLREQNHGSLVHFPAFYLWGYIVFVWMDDFQLHKQLPKDQQGIKDDQADNHDLSEEKNQCETLFQCSLHLNTPQRYPARPCPVSLIWLVAFHRAFCCSHPELSLLQP